MKVTIIPIMIGAFGRVTKGLLKGLEELDVGGRVETIKEKIIENSENTEKSSGDLRRLAVTQTPVKEHHLTLIWKTPMEMIIIIIIKISKATKQQHCRGLSEYWVES